MAADPDLVSQFYTETDEVEESLEQIIERRAVFLVGYQDAAYAQRYTDTLGAFRSLLPDHAKEELTEAAARSLFKLMAYKDEFEVARLMTGTGFKDQVAQEFEGDFSINYHLAPPLLSRKKDARGRPLKKSFGPWLRPALSVLSHAKFLRPSRFNPFGYHEEARLHRSLLAWYEAALRTVAASYNSEKHRDCLQVLAAPMEIRGYGPVRLQAAHKHRASAERLLKKL